MFASKVLGLQKILASHTPTTLLRDLLFNTSDHEERVRIIDRVRSQSPDIIQALYIYLGEGHEFDVTPDVKNYLKVKDVIIAELENAMLKQAIEDKLHIDLAVYSPRPGRSI